MNINIKVLPKYAYLVSSLIALIIFFYFSYKAVVAYLIHKELYGDGMDVLVSLKSSASRCNAFADTAIFSIYKN